MKSKTNRTTGIGLLLAMNLIWVGHGNAAECSWGIQLGDTAGGYGIAMRIPLRIPLRRAANGQVLRAISRGAIERDDNFSQSRNRRAGLFSRILFCMKNFVVGSGDFITTSGIYRMNDHPGREITLIYGDAVPTFQGKKVTFRLIRAAKNPRRG
jgi:hypothetical protein